MRFTRRINIYEMLEADQQRREAQERERPLVINVPHVRTEPPPQPPAERCSVLDPDGRQCELPPLKPGGMCARHMRWNNIYPTALPPPDNPLGLQEMMGYAVVCTFDKLLDGKQALAIAQLGRVMQKNMALCQGQKEEIGWRRTHSQLEECKKAALAGAASENATKITS